MRWLWPCLLFFVIPFASAFDAIEAARQAIERGDGVRAMRLLRPLAEDNQPEACYWLGRLYFYDVPGVRRNYREAARWFRQAAEAGHPDAQYKLGGMYYAGRGVPSSVARAAYWWQKAARQRQAEALNNLGALLATGQGVEQDAELGMALQMMAARRGSEAAAENLKRKTLTSAARDLAAQLESNPALFLRVIDGLRLGNERRRP